MPEINEIVPLPPAPLPAWDGKLTWLAAREANIPSAKPAGSLIAQLAQAKKLTLITGRPLPDSADFDRNSGAQLFFGSGEPCPQSGYWQVTWSPYGNISQQTTRYFNQGTPMPTDRVETCQSRIWPLSRNMVVQDTSVAWRFLGEG